jgi:PadR family transcriptional regulator AphA
VVERSLTEWVVLALLGEGPNHGFALTRELAPDGAIGRVWTVGRPLTYRALDLLVATDLATPAGITQGQGPRRRVHAITPAGRRALRQWFTTPVTHLRDVRTELLAKLVLLDRAGRDPSRLIEAQRAALAPTVDALRRDRATDPVTLWRKESASATSRFLDGISRAAARSG